MNTVPYSLQCEAPLSQVNYLGVNASSETFNFTIYTHNLMSICLLIYPKPIMSWVQSILNGANSKKSCLNTKSPTQITQFVENFFYTKSS